MTDIDSMVANFQHMKALEFRDRIPTKVESSLVLPNASCVHILKLYFDDTKELEFDIIFNRPIGRRCIKEYVVSESEVQIEPSSEKLLMFLEEVDQIGKQPVQAKIKGYRRSIRGTTQPVSSKQQVDKIYNDYVDNSETQQQLWKRKPAVVTRCCAVYKTLKEDDKLSTLKGIFTELRLEATEFLKKGAWLRFLQSSHFIRYCQWKQLELNLQVGFSDFMITRILGSGGFGEVHGCRKIDTGTMYAMKKLDKKRLKSKACERLALEERNILAELNSKFTTNLKYAFQDKHTLYLVMELMDGGDLSFNLKQSPGGAFTEYQTQFYTAEISLGLAHIHSRGIVYRDMKPANILLDTQGHARISDMGLARKCVITKPTSSSGTHGYMAPEVLKDDVAYGRHADWFGLGCTAYELLVGRIPFVTRNEMETKKWPSNPELDRRTLSATFIEFPPDMSTLAQSCLCSLLESEPTNRLGCGDNDESDHHQLVCHAWLSGLDWQALAEHKVVGALKPKHGQVNAEDIHDIDRLYHNAKEIKRLKLTADDDKHYDNFDLVMSRQWQTEVLPMFEMISEMANKLDTKRLTSITSSAKQLAIDGDDVTAQGYMYAEVVACKSMKWVQCYVCLHRINGVEIRKEQRQLAHEQIPYELCEFDVEDNDDHDRGDVIISLKDDVRLKPYYRSDGATWCRVLNRAISEATGRKNDKIEERGFRVSSIVKDTTTTSDRL